MFFLTNSKRKLNFANLAKETILQGEYTVLSDVWSVGIALWEIFSLGDEPFNGLNQEDIRRLIQRGYQLPPPASCSRQFHHVMLNCWVDSTERPTLSRIRENLETAIQEYIPIGDASSRDETGPSASPDDTYSSERSTYGFTDYSHRRREENIYEQMEGSFETISESMQ
ncbi:Ephrin type-A receptor 10 [Holothuria leucospilota]|uniref:Ephrin type-A receptor 10 n=1 Tax=Holothuria leucospilota TaxID=206669 RepID=A0A9Q1BXI6_HOLLE|nr:Ephrin type-A receptor 10 [Holothuria leucospilota]